jgi:hypothetical protein
MVLTDVQGKSVRNYAEGVAAIQARYSTTSTAAVTEIPLRFCSSHRRSFS